MATAASLSLPRSVEEQLQSMTMMVERMASILQELQSVKTNMAELRELLREEQLQPEETQEAFEVQERGEFFLDSTHECIEVQESFVCPEPTESCLNSFQEGDKMQDVTSSSSDFDVGSSTSDLVSDFHNLKPWKCPKTGDATDESSRFDTPGSFLIVSHNEPSCSALSVSSLSMPSLIMPLSPSSSPEVSVTFLPLSCLPSSLSLFNAIVPVLDFSLVKRRGRGSKKKIDDRVVWQPTTFSECEFLGLVGFTWLNKVELEDSYVQLDATLFNLQKGLGGSQLDNVFFHCQRYCSYILILHKDLGIQNSSQVRSPIALHSGCIISLGIFKSRLPQEWVLILQCSPTINLLHVWFKGKFIAMLFGRSCCLSKKDKQKAI